MKQYFSLLCMVLVLPLMSCDKKGTETETNQDLYKNSPRSEVPDALAPATWSDGTISALGYYNDNGNHVGNAYSAALEYKVTKDGYYEFAQFFSTEGSTSSCINEYFTYLKGTVKFEGNKLTFYPVEGKFRTVKTSRSTSSTSCPISNTQRVATKEELKDLVTTYYWKTNTIDNSLYLEVYSEDDPNMQGFVVFSFDVIK